MLEIVPPLVLWWPADAEPTAARAVPWDLDEQGLTEITENVVSVVFVCSCSVRPDAEAIFLVDSLIFRTRLNVLSMNHFRG